MSQKLFLLDDNSSDSEIELTVNKDYANRYDKWREGEELQKYKDLLKDEEDSESSSESEEVEEEFDEEFFRALSLLKGKDPRLYDKNFQLFKEKQLVKKPKTEKQKPIYMKDYERSLVLERGGKFSDEDEDVNKLERITTYNEEQENVKKSFKEAIGDSDDSDADDLLQVKTKTKKEEEEEDADYVKWLKGEEEKEIDKDIEKDLSYLKNYWNDPKLDEGEKFLRDYILNKKYLEKDDKTIPSYEEITSGMLSDDEKMIEEQEKFEHKYNFRFEEPDEEFIKRYPRTISDSLRRVDTRRKEKREEKTERKRKEREQRREELKRLKALKRKEIEEKFMKLKEISGQDEINLKESDIESDFDPDKHDQRMKEMFNDEYYQVEEEQKPEFPYDEELDSENWNAWAGEKIIEESEDDKNLSDEDENSNNLNESTTNPKDEFANEMINACRPKKKVKKKSLFAKIISQPKPVYDPDGKSFEEYLDEYYKLDYEDVVGDMPVRYKYRKVIPNDFGLSVNEILTADDRELNRWCSVKKTCMYRNEDEELYDVQAFRKKAQIPQIKQKCLPSVFAPKDVDDNDSTISDCKKLKKKKIDNQMNNIVENSEKNEIESKSTPEFSKSENVIQSTDENFDSSLEMKKHKKKSKKKKRKHSACISENDESTDFAQGDKNECSLVSSIDDNADEDQDVQEEERIKKSKKKKHKDKKNISNDEVESEISNVITENSYKDLNADETSINTDTSPKSTKKKRKHSDIVSDSDEITNSHSNIVTETAVSENTSDTHPKKKKKKRNKNKNMANEQQNTSNHFHNKSSTKQKFRDKQHKFVSEDKRLGLSDERLAAYGINPKKFKNKIIYSKK